MKKKIWIKRKDKIRQRYWVGRKLKSYGSSPGLFPKASHCDCGYEFAEGMIRCPYCGSKRKRIASDIKPRKQYGSFTNIVFSKKDNIKKIRAFNERKALARDLYQVDQQLKTAIEGGQREELENKREDLAKRIGESIDKYGHPVFFPRRNYGSFGDEFSDKDDIVIEIGRKVADKHRRQLIGLNDIAKNVDEKLAREIPDDIGFAVTPKGIQRLRLNPEDKKDIARELIRTAENELIRQDIQDGLAQKLHKKDYYFLLDKEQKAKINRMIRKNIETN